MNPSVVGITISLAACSCACASTTPKPDSPAAVDSAAPSPAPSPPPAAVAPAVGSTSGQAETNPSGTSVTYVTKEKVSSLFAGKGGPLGAAENYKVMAARRDKVDKAEVHTLDTDIFYIVEGTATIVTGGELVDGAPSAPDEIRGVSIKGGESRKLEKGDALIIPRGIPHWMNQVTPGFIYFVVKVR